MIQTTEFTLLPCIVEDALVHLQIIKHLNSVNWVILILKETIVL